MCVSDEWRLTGFVFSFYSCSFFLLSVYFSTASYFLCGENLPLRPYIPFSSAGPGRAGPGRLGAVHERENGCLSEPKKQNPSARTSLPRLGAAELRLVKRPGGSGGGGGGAREKLMIVFDFRFELWIEKQNGLQHVRVGLTVVFLR